MKQEIVDKNFIDNFRSHLQKKKPKNCLIITSQGNLERGRLEEFKSILYLHNIQVEIFLVNDYPDFKIISEALNSKQKKCNKNRENRSPPISTMKTYNQMPNVVNTPLCTLYGASDSIADRVTS